MKEFDQAARAGVRQGLIDYMKRHAVAVPTLFKRIAGATRPEDIPISLSTLQRFLANSHRTDDMYVGALGRFLDRCDTNCSDAGLGRSLAAFYEARLGYDYAGTFVRPEEMEYFADRKFVIERGDQFWRVTVKSPPEDYHMWRGIIAEAHGFAVFVLKDVLTGLPATYFLVNQADRLSGIGIRARYMGTGKTEFGTRRWPQREEILGERQKEETTDAS